MVNECSCSFAIKKAWPAFALNPENSQYPFETKIAERLLTLRDCDNVKFIKNFDTEIKKHEEKIDIELSEKQFEAVKQINESKNDSFWQDWEKVHKK